MLICGRQCFAARDLCLVLPPALWAPIAAPVIERVNPCIMSSSTAKNFSSHQLHKGREQTHTAR